MPHISNAFFLNKRPPRKLNEAQRVEFWGTFPLRLDYTFADLQEAFHIAFTRHDQRKKADNLEATFRMEWLPVVDQAALLFTGYRLQILFESANGYVTVRRQSLRV